MDPIQAITNLKQIQHLIHLVARAYYDAREIIVLDVLLHNDYVQDGQLASAVGYQPKELQKICGRLKAHGMLKIESRMEEIPYPKDYVPPVNQEKKERRKINRTYYYIDYGLAVNSVKYKIYQIQKKLDSEVTESSNQFPYKCSGCGKVYSALEMLSLSLNAETGMFLCEIDEAELDIDTTPDTAAGNAQYVKFMTENGQIVELLKKADDLYIPESKPHLPDPTAMVPVANSPTGGDQESKESSIKIKQSTVAPQNQIIVEIEEDKQQNTTDAAQDLQAYYASLENDNAETPSIAIDDSAVIGLETNNPDLEEDSDEEEEFQEI